jgi:endo-1,4-beta-mannosidase
MAMQIHHFLQQATCLEFDTVNGISIDTECQFIHYQNNSKNNLLDLAAECRSVIKNLDPNKLVTYSYNSEYLPQ